MYPIACIAALLCLLIPPAQGQDFYDSEGSYRGSVDSDGYIHGIAGEDLGRVDEQGYLYRPNGDDAGRIDEQGYLYGPNGDDAGHVDGEGFVYGPRGDYRGRIETDGFYRKLGINRAWQDDVLGTDFDGRRDSADEADEDDDP